MKASVVFADGWWLPATICMGGVSLSALLKRSNTCSMDDGRALTPIWLMNFSLFEHDN